MIRKIGDALSDVARRTVPDPFVLALGLTVVVMFWGWRHTSGSAEFADTNVWLAWFDGFTSSGGMAFALKMALILVTGHALASSKPVRAAVDRLAQIPKSSASAAALVAFVACLAGVIHWGLGAIVGALLAREIGRSAENQGIRLHYPLLGAAAYCGLAVWHGGLSGSAPLVSAVEDSSNFTYEIVGAIPLADTVFGTLNLVVTGGLLALIPLLFYLMAPRDPQQCTPPPVEALTDPPPAARGSSEEPESLLQRIQDAPFGGVALGGTAVALLAWAIWVKGALSFDLDTVILLFLFAGLALQGSVVRFANAVADGARGAGGIVLQFPFYFGIMQVMKVCGLITWTSEKLIAISNETTFPIVAFLSAGLVNLVVPSGGGQWGVQGELLMRAGEGLGVDPSTTIMAFSYGDAWTNMLQPFWALPLLGIMGLKARDIIGYTAMVFLLMLVVVPLLLVVVS